MYKNNTNVTSQNKTGTLQNAKLMLLSKCWSTNSRKARIVSGFMPL